MNTQPDLTLTAPRVSDGPVKGGNGAFSDPSQWIDVTDPDNTGTLAPASSDDADFPSGGDVSGSGDVAALTVESSVEFSANVSAGSITNSGQVTISGGTLSTTGELNNTGGITLGSGALISDFVSDTGNIGVGSGGSLSTTANLYVGSGGDGTLSVTNGASVDVGTFTEIGGAGGYGTVTIDGSQWTSGPAVPPGTSTQTGNVDVGDDGTGGLTVTNGSTVTVNGGIYVGSADPGETGSGTLTIDGGSTVYANGDFGVRLAQDPGSSGTLILTGAGTELFAGSASVTDSDEFSIGSASGSGTAVVADGALAVTEDFAIGSGVEGHPNGGTGVGTIKSGATVESGSGQVGAFGGTGTLTVDDALWAITGELDIGAEGGQTQIANGTLIVQNRGTVTDATGSIATFAASGTEQGTTGTVTITGPASRWDNTGDLDVGNGGTGALTIQDGGSVSVGGLLDIGTQSGAVGTVTVADSASSIALAGDLTVGDAGTGTLALANGTSTAITGDTDIGAQQGGDGTVDLNPGAFLGGGGDLTVGYGGIGDLELSNASTATFGGDLGEAAEGGSSGTITVDNSIFDVTGSATVGDGGSGTLSAIDGSTFDVGAVAQIGNSTGGNGGLLLDASQMAIGPAVPSDTSTQAGNLGIGNDSTGVATVTDGATLTVNGGIYVGSADPGDTASGTLTIDGGSTVYANGDFGVRLGQDPGSSGTLVVTGAGSALFAGSPSVTGVDEFGVASGAGAATAVIADQALVQTEDFFFGSVVEPYTDGGTGSATMESAATVESGDGGVGAFGGSGSITVDDALWAITGELDVGQSGGATQVGQGLLIVQDGGTVTDATGTVATYQPGSGQQTETGTVVVTGAASLWDTSGDLYVGDAAAGTLSISDGGTVVVGGNLDIGTQTSAVGTVMLSGSTSTLSVTGPVIVGDDGNGVLDLSQGATLTADSLMIGSTGGGGGTLAVDGATLTVDGNANVDTGTLDVENGATLTVTGSLTGGGIAGSSATISIGDAQVTADVGGNLLVGEGGTLDLEVGGGITVSVGSDVLIALAQGGSGTLTVSDMGTTLNDLLGEVGVGVAGNGTLAIVAGATLISQQADIGELAGAGGTVTLIDASSLWDAGPLVVGDGGTGSLDIDSFATLLTVGAALGDTAGSVGYVNVENRGTWADTGALIVGQLGRGTLDIFSGSTVTETTTTDVGVQIGSSSLLTLDTGAWLTADSVVMSDGATLSISSGAVLTVLGNANIRDPALDPVGLLVNGVGTIDAATVVATGAAIFVGDTLGPLAGGAGVLTVSGGATVHAGETNIGVAGDGTLALIEPDTNWQNDTGETVGYGGTLLVLAGSTLTDLAGANVLGSATISAATWAVTGDIRVEQSGTGSPTATMTVRNGATVSDTDGTVSSASVLVDGATWTGSASLVIGSGGSVDVTDQGMLNNAGELDIGESTGSGDPAVLQVTSAGVSADYLSIVSTGTLLASQAGFVSADDVVGSGGNLGVDYGRVLAGMDGATFLGTAITVTDGQLVSISTISLASTTVTVDATGTISALTSLELENAGIGLSTVTLDNGTLTAGLVTLDATSTIIGTGAIVGNVSGGTIIAQGGELEITGSVTNAFVRLAPDPTLQLDSTVDATTTISWSAPGGTVDLGEPEAVHGTFEGFGTGDVIDLPSLGIDGSQFANGTLTLTAGQVVVADLIFSGTSLTASNFQLSPEGVSIAWQPSCYAAGTRILTPRGEVPVDALRPGEAVVTIDPHGARRIDIVRWIGRRQLDLSTHPDPDLAAPVRLRAGAIAPGVPTRDLLLSPDHCVLMDGHLIRAWRLINGVSVVQDYRCTITYLHVALDRHALLLAEGLIAESYLDEGHADFFRGTLIAPGPLHERPMESCAPFVPDDAFAERVWRRLAARAGVQPPAHGLRAPRLRAIADDRSLRPVAMGDHRIFPLPRGATHVRLVSDAMRPTDARPWADDRRRLGVAVRRIMLDGTRSLPLDDPRLGRGWWAPEPGGRWTDGDAYLHLPPGTNVLELRLAR